MDKLQIRGGTPLSGTVVISGAKNAALPILIASLLTEEQCIFKNVPDLRDVNTSLSLIKELGATTTRQDNGDVDVKAGNIDNYTASYELVKTMRASILVLGPLLSRFGRANVSLPGGCAIGARPVNLHLDGLRQMGANIEVDGGYVRASCSGKLQGCKIFLDTVSVGATENLMMAATLAEGETVIENAAREPEIVDLAHCLSAMGAEINGAGTDTIVIQGKEKLNGCIHEVLPDRIETGTFLVAAAATRGKIRCERAAPNTLEAVLNKLTQAGAHITSGDNWIELDMMQAQPQAVSIKTAPHPGFPTDMQAQFVALNSIAQGAGVVTENIFENRFMHVPELQRMGADIELQGNSAVSKGGSILNGAPVMATDLRASASLIIAALAAQQGETIVDRIYHLDRGYESIEEKLSGLGADIKRLKS
ncbi:MAG: UDP-N-acetylglucosamine 1-carboxyvinyltransferase [Alteromonadaceae bacterium]|nr:UDP-N-acetylglucosamine 1-carboxyvinyltransferase [Alteromonadaceae bacterium]